MSRHQIPWLIVLALGLAVGVVGGGLTGETWYHGGEAVVLVGFLVLYLLALWKRPPSVGDLEPLMPGEDEPPLFYSETEAKAALKDRGAIVERK